MSRQTFATLTERQRKAVLDAACNARSITTLALGFPFIGSCGVMMWQASSHAGFSLIATLTSLCYLVSAALFGWAGMTLVVKGLKFAVIPAIETYEKVTENTPNRLRSPRYHTRKC
jgi:hypothetical protein